jgi:hypothetical protein
MPTGTRVLSGIPATNEVEHVDDRQVAAASSKAAAKNP